MDQQTYPLTRASNFISLKTRSPSVCRSDSASLRLHSESGSISSIADSDKTVSSIESSSYDTCPESSSLRSLNPGSLESLAHSVGIVFSRIQTFSRFIPLKPRSPSISRSESVSLRLDSGSILSVTDSEQTIPTDSDSQSAYNASSYSEDFPLPSIGFESSESLASSEATISKLSLLSRAETITRSSLASLDSSSTNTPPYPEDIRNAVNLMTDDLVIAFMGLTGSGRSHFIDTLTNQPGLRSGSALQSCTDQVRAVRMLQHPKYADRLVFVDTPGFNHTYKSDMEVLRVISNWLRQTYQNNIRLSGVVYLHQITGQMTGTCHRNLYMFGKLCGDRAMKKVVLVTWGETGTEHELRSEHWRAMIQKVASVARFRNTSESAWEIIESIVQEPTRQVLLLQEELVNLKIPLHKTGAGMACYTDIQ